MRIPSVTSQGNTGRRDGIKLPSITIRRSSLLWGLVVTVLVTALEFARVLSTREQVPTTQLTTVLTSGSLVLAVALLADLRANRRAKNNSWAARGSIGV